MKHIKNKIKAFIFDLDGTILQTEHLWEQATLDVLEKKGISIPESDKLGWGERFSGKGLVEIAQMLKESFDFTETIEEFIEEKRAHTLSLFQDKNNKSKLNFIKGFKEFHSQISEHSIPNCIATNADSISLDHMKNLMNLDSFFKQNIFNIAHVENKAKPDPSLFIYAAEKLGAKPKDCIVFEDSLPGFIAAQKANMRCIAIKNKNNKQHLSLAHKSINNYFEALETLKGLIKL
ncbi:HAD family phosphatase [Candidatus Babeliales bacterium]|nr:HAD family phosphatase [Candidatus Babeliales bacterium]